MQPIQPVLPFTKELEIEVAKNQPEYLTLPVFRTNWSSISRWKLTEQERKHLIDGGDLFLVQINGQGPLQPIMPLAEREENILEIVLECEKGLGLS